MTKFALSGYFGPEDTHQARVNGEVEATRINLGTTPMQLACGVGNTITVMRNLNVWPSEIGIDLLVLAILVYAADTRLNRTVCAEDGWTREIILSVPVSDPALWKGAVPTLETILRFLTGDRWEIEFRARPNKFHIIAPVEASGSEEPHFDGICLYSGGLDSLIGLIDEIKRGRFPLFVSHAGEAAVSRPQADLFDELRATLKRVTGSNRPIERVRYAGRIPTNLFQGVDSENTTRGRSFMFLAIAAASGTGLREPFDLLIPRKWLHRLECSD
jgi:hypothetical protein